MNPTPKKRELIASIMIFLYVVIGYLIIMYFLDPKMFIPDLPNQWWIFPFALIVAAIRFLSSKRGTFKTRDKDDKQMR